MIEEEVQTHAPSHTHSYTHIHVCVCVHTDKLNGKLVGEAGEQTLLAGSLWTLASRNHVVVLIKKLTWPRLFTCHYPQLIGHVGNIAVSSKAAI